MARRRQEVGHDPEGGLYSYMLRRQGPLLNSLDRLSDARVSR